MKTIEHFDKAIAEADAAYTKLGQELSHLTPTQRMKDRRLHGAYLAKMKLMNAKEKFLMDQRRELCGMNDVVKMIRSQFNLKASTKQTTAVKGHYNWTTGYRFYGHNTLHFVGVVREFGLIVKAIEATHQIEVEHPTYSLARGYVASIKLITKK